MKPPAKPPVAIEGRIELRRRPGSAMRARSHHVAQAYRLFSAGDAEGAQQALQAALQEHPREYAALHLMGVIAFERGEYEAAVRWSAQAIAADAAPVLAFQNLANALLQLDRVDEALSLYDQALLRAPDNPVTHNNRANALRRMKRTSEAAEGYGRAAALDEGLANASRMQMFLLQNAARWDELPPVWARERARIDADASDAPSFPALALPGIDARRALSAARGWSRLRYGKLRALPFTGPTPAHARLRVAYVSRDFGNHPMSYLMAEVFELHDRARFEVYAISRAPRSDAPIQQRLRRGFEHFIDARGWSRAELVRWTRAQGIDIAVDLMGHTDGNVFDAFAVRLAPIQVNYLGYPGTLGAGCMDYIIGDRWVTPEAHWPWLTEQPVLLPVSFQANDRQRPMGRAPSRESCGLPAQGFVFCCFNNVYKITPHVFDIWMRLLQRVPGSVLWLAPSDPGVVGQLCAQAQARGVGAERLVFSRRVDYADYLARYPLADLFLDTLPFNAGTTASDALWAGLPVLTQVGDTFAGRMAASLLEAVGLPELITDHAADYEALALGLASDPERLAALRARLQSARQSAPLFDTPRFTRELESAYEAMWQRHLQGLPPAPIEVARGGAGAAAAGA